MKTKAQAMELVRAAFLQAQRKLGADATTMTLGVLKNRLLQITDRRFDPSEFGAQDMREFVNFLAPEIKFTNVQPHGKVELLAACADKSNSLFEISGREKNQSLEQSASVIQNAAQLHGNRIREDLWVAVLDYASGQTYVWDEQQGRARSAKEVDQQPRMPTLTPVELGEWRQTFLNERRAELSGIDLVTVQRWQEQGLPTTYLPLALQQPWNRELTLRVRQRLHDFFVSLKSGAPTSSGMLPNSPPGKEALADELTAAKDRGDGFTVGELLAQQLAEAPESATEGLLARVVGAWSSPRGMMVEPESLSDLAGRMESFSRQNLATAFVNALHRLDAVDLELNEATRDFAYRLRDDLADAYNVDKRSATEMCRAALARLEDLLAQGDAAVARFLRTTPATVKLASIELLKLSHRLQPLLIHAERDFLGDLEILLGPAFRKFCEAYERNVDAEVIRRAPEYLENIKSHRPEGRDPRLRSRIWMSFVQPVLEHLTTIIEDATSKGEAALAPALSLRNPNTKADLRAAGCDIFLSLSLLNQGKGHARDVSLNRVGSDVDDGISLVLAEPTGPFDVPPEREQLIRLRLVLNSAQESLELPIEWLCQTNLGKQAVKVDRLIISQQITEPDWSALLADPPYTLNPIKRADRLYGRRTTLAKLQLAAMAGTSTFVWGQKRIGKTSLLQVLAAELSGRADTTCILLRMGELASLHEGQLAHLIAKRLVANSPADMVVPEEAEFGAGLGRLVPFSEKLSTACPGRKFVVIIDEFDDLDPAFYTGERGKQFVKALRSASEVGLTFFFVGSERMDAIYGRHQADLNKWTNVRLDRIDSRSDCRALIVEPVTDAIEFDAEAIDFITDYTAGNPFYIHNLCYQLFERCLQERRTFVDANDTHAVRQQLLRALGPTNFSHLWEDNPVLDPQEKRKESAENCIALSCISALGGRYEAFEEIPEIQECLPLAAEDRANGTELRRACARLVKRNVLVNRKDGPGYVIGLQIFREWLGENAKSQLLPIWVDHLASVRLAADSSITHAPVEGASESSNFPIAEDDMLAVAQRLIYCGRQKDVAEIKSWLRQFDDDSRIEMAFLLLKRIADRGFINEGMRALGLQKIEEMINAKRKMLGNSAWTIVKSRRDNLAIAYVDSEHKSGASTARELQKAIRPGKCSSATELDSWMRTHACADPLVTIVDDFSGTGGTLVKGMRKFQAKISPDVWQLYVQEGRLALIVMYAFPEALEAVRKEFPGISVSAATILGEELRACDDESQIFTNQADRNFAREVLQQIGRELSPSAPLGHGDMGALVIFHNAAPNNTLPIFWSGGAVAERPWRPLFPRA